MIETERLAIRDYEKEDLEIVHELVQEPDIYNYQHWGPNSFDDSRNYIEMCIEQQGLSPRLSYELCMSDKETGVLVGAIGIRVRNTVSKKADIGYWVRKDWWGKGIATESVKAIIKFGFEKLQMNRIWATASPENIASIRVLEKAGMKKEGLMRDDLLVRGEYRDSVLMAVLAKDYSHV